MNKTKTIYCDLCQDTSDDFERQPGIDTRFVQINRLSIKKPNKINYSVRRFLLE